MTNRSPESQALQDAARKEVRLSTSAKKALKKISRERIASQSEVMRVVLQRIADEEAPAVVPQKRTERVSFWDPDGLYERAARRARRLDVPLVILLDQAIHEEAAR